MRPPIGFFAKVLATIQLPQIIFALQSARSNLLGGLVGDPISKSIGGQFSQWSPFLPCSRSCGGGTSKRTRICLNGNACIGPVHEQKTCNVQLCGSGLVRGLSNPWNEWAPWSGCSKTCGGGQQFRFRLCSSGLGCAGTNREERMCNTGICQLTIKTNNQLSNHLSNWRDWTAWSVCDAVCGAGRQRRTRLCVGGSCIGSNNEERHCTRGLCGGNWNEWAAFSPCDRSCGGGKEVRRRVCIAGTNCPGNAEEIRVCNSQICGHGQWTDWSAFSTCSQTCGGGRQTRKRTCNRGAACPGNNDESRACNSHLCPKGTLPLQNNINSWSAWTAYSACSASCGVGQETRQRHCIGSISCPGLAKEQRPCNKATCVLGKWTSWTAWTTCTRSCNSGTERRTRVCQGGACPGDNNETRKCNVQSCTVWSNWRDIGACSRTCGLSGVKRRTRTCPSSGCVGTAEEFVACNRVAC